MAILAVSPFLISAGGFRPPPRQCGARIVVVSIIVHGKATHTATGLHTELYRGVGFQSSRSGVPSGGGVELSCSDEIDSHSHFGGRTEEVLL